MKILKNLLNNFWNTLTKQNLPNKWRNIACFILVVVFFLFLTIILQRQNFSLKVQAPKSEISNLISLNQENSFERIKLEAKAAYVFDVLKNQPLFELNAEVQLPLASLTKIMTAVVAKENSPDYLLVTIPKEAILQEGDEGFLADEKWPLSDLIDAMLISSSNDAAFALAFEFEKNFGQSFVSLMNQKAKDLGLMQTYFLNPTGLDLSENTSGAYGSAKDMAKLLLYVFKNHFSLIEITRFSEVEINQRKFKNTNLLVNELPNLIAGKTGYSDLSGGNLAVIVDKGYGHPLIIVVLGSTFTGRFNDVKNLYNAFISDTINL